MQAGFPPPPAPGNTGKKVVIALLIFLVVLLILSGIGYAVWYFLIRKDDSDTEVIEDEEVLPESETETETEQEQNDEVEPNDYLGKYQVFNSHAIRGNNLKCIKEQTPTKCAKECLDTNMCKSYDFNKSSAECCLSSKTRKTAGSAYYQNDDWDYYELKDVNPSDYFSHFENHAIRGNNIKCIKDQTPAKCAQQCLETDTCKSYDFNKSTAECCLSSKTRKTAGSAYYQNNDWDYYEIN